MSAEREFVCGTRAVVRTDAKGRRKVDGNYWRVVCATCDGGGAIAYATKERATEVAVRDSGRPCQCKGCNAR